MLGILDANIPDVTTNPPSIHMWLLLRSIDYNTLFIIVYIKDIVILFNAFITLSRFIIILCGIDNISWNIIKYSTICTIWEYFDEYCKSHVTLLWIWKVLSPCSKWVIGFSPMLVMPKGKGICLVEAYYVIRLLVDGVMCKDLNSNPRLHVHVQNT